MYGCDNSGGHLCKGGKPGTYDLEKGPGDQMATSSCCSAELCNYEPVSDPDPYAYLSTTAYPTPARNQPNQQGPPSPPDDQQARQLGEMLLTILDARYKRK